MLLPSVTSGKCDENLLLCEKHMQKIQYIIIAENHEGFYRKKSFLFAFQEKKKEPPKKAPICPLGLGRGGNNQLKLKLKPYCTENSRTLTYPV